MDKYETNKQDMIDKLNKHIELTDDVKQVLEFGYRRGFTDAKKSNRRDAVITSLFTILGCIIGVLGTACIIKLIA
jgi:hypothetical protein